MDGADPFLPAVRRVLASSGCHLQLYADGRSALSASNAAVPDVVVSTPELLADGFLSMLRSHMPTATTPVLVVSTTPAGEVASALHDDPDTTVIGPGSDTTFGQVLLQMLGMSAPH